MGVFRDQDEAKKYLGGIFEQAMDDAELSDLFAASGVVLQISYTDPAAQITIDMPSKKVFTDGCDLKPTVEMFMTCDMGNQFWLGNLNLAVAMAKGQVRAKGPVPKILKLIPVAKQLFPHYQEMLRADGRGDLIDA